MSLADVGMAADSVILVSYPHYQDDVESCCCVIEELGHYGFHSWQYTRENIQQSLITNTEGNKQHLSEYSKI